MTNTVKEGADLLSLVEAAEKHLKSRGHEVAFATNDQLTAFDITRPSEDGDDIRLCRVQAVREDSWELVRANGETVTGLGSETIFLTMLEKVVEATDRRPGR
ncbi:MAG TPA: hypothetical protein VMM59_10650 [Thermohalobaculum sp.]|nr:hypothetical protein [Thermohalobaculum sp.]